MASMLDRGSGRSTTRPGQVLLRCPRPLDLENVRRAAKEMGVQCRGSISSFARGVGSRGAFEINLVDPGFAAYLFAFG